ncbi:MAG: ribosomal protein S18-alanine N-acetyltransferase [Proteobacteria bacterium]|nr:ribosomal protein S18-alanine N-acetyltransferase [Pseudomonadota bacterium]
MKGERFKEEREPCAFFIRPMAVEDIGVVTAIESENPAPWSGGQLAGELDQEGGWQFVAESRAFGQVCGFVCGRSCVGDGELLKIAVGREHRRQGAAAQLVAHTLHYLAAQGVARCFLEVRAANLPALALYERFGFRRLGVRKKYYASPPDDAILLEKNVALVS